MEFLAELLLDLLLEGSIELLGCQKVPVFLRIIAGMILGIVYAGLITLSVILAANGFRDRDWPLLAVGLGMIALFAAFGVFIIKKWNKTSNKTD